MTSYKTHEIIFFANVYTQCFNRRNIMKKLQKMMVAAIGAAAVLIASGCASAPKAAEMVWSDNILVNGDFEAGQGNWTPWIDSGWGGAGEVTWDNGIATLRIDEMGEQPWAVAMHYKKVTFEKGARYVARFKMKSDMERVVRFSIGNGLAPADPPYLEYQDIVVGTDWQTYEFEFVMKFRTNKFGRLDFNCAYNPGMFLPEGHVWKDEAKLKATGAATVYIDDVEVRKLVAAAE